MPVVIITDRQLSEEDVRRLNSKVSDVLNQQQLSEPDVLEKIKEQVSLLVS